MRVWEIERDTDTHADKDSERDKASETETGSRGKSWGDSGMKQETERGGNRETHTHVRRIRRTIRNMCIRGREREQERKRESKRESESARVRHKVKMKERGRHTVCVCARSHGNQDFKKRIT